MAISSNQPVLYKPTDQTPENYDPAQDNRQKDLDKARRDENTKAETKPTRLPEKTGGKIDVTV